MNVALFPDVVVNDDTIPSAAIAAEAQNHTGPREKPGIAWRKAAQALAIRALLLQDGTGPRAFRDRRGGAHSRASR
jgi:peptidyl-prolyl cis-trans isomerase C